MEKAHRTACSLWWMYRTLSNIYTFWIWLAIKFMGFLDHGQNACDDIGGSHHMQTDHYPPSCEDQKIHYSSTITKGKPIRCSLQGLWAAMLLISNINVINPAFKPRLMQALYAWDRCPTEWPRFHSWRRNPGGGPGEWDGENCCWFTVGVEEIHTVDI